MGAAEQPEAGRYTFPGGQGRVTVDATVFEVAVDGTPVSVEPQVFDVLHHLVANRDRVVPKEELLDQIWGDRFVGDSALASRIRSARRAVGDDGRRQQVIRTVHGRGYQFIAPVDVAAATDGADGRPDAGAAGPAPAPVPAPAAIPRPVKSLLGRDRLVAELSERIEPGGLVTLVGPAGVGKTHLAGHVASSLADRFPDGSWFVSLAPVRDPEIVALVVLDAMGDRVPAASTPRDRLLDLLTGRASLLVLDNCEHVLDAVASLVAGIGQLGGPSAVLATSRQRLGLPGERVVPVPVLDAQASAELFATRADQIGVAIEPDDAGVVDICRLLDHLPLAVELAGAHTRILGLDQLSSLLDERMKLLVGTGEVDDHHRTLEQAIGSSFDALDPELAESLCRLAVFAGPFDLDAAHALITTGNDLSQIDAVRHLVELAERSLLVVETSGPQAQYRLLESVRLFGLDRLTDPGLIERAHVAFYGERARQREELLHGPDYEQAFADLDRDWDNCRAAIDFALVHDLIDEAMALLSATILYAELQLRFEHGDWATKVLAVADSSTPLAADTRAGLARLEAWQGRLDRAAELVATVGGPDTALSPGLAHLWVAAMTGDHDRAIELIERLDAATRGTGGLYELVIASIHNRIATNAGVDPGDATDRIRRLALAGGPIARAFALHADVHEALQSGHYERALPLCEDLAKAATEAGLIVIAQGSSTSRALALQHTENPVEQAASARRGLDDARRARHWIAIGVDAEVAASALDELGRPEAAARILGGCSTLGYRGHSSDFADALTARLQARLGPAFAPAHDAGRQLSPPELCQLAIDQLDAVVPATG